MRGPLLSDWAPPLPFHRVAQLPVGQDVLFAKALFSDALGSTPADKLVFKVDGVVLLDPLSLRDVEAIAKKAAKGEAVSVDVMTES